MTMVSSAEEPPPVLPPLPPPVPDGPVGVGPVGLPEGGEGRVGLEPPPGDPVGLDPIGGLVGLDPMYGLVGLLAPGILALRTHPAEDREYCNNRERSGGSREEDQIPVRIRKGNKVRMMTGVLDTGH